MINNRKVRDAVIISLAVILPLCFSLYFVHENISKIQRLDEFKTLLNHANFSFNAGNYGEAINNSNQVLNNASSEEFPEQYAMAQYVIGNSYYSLSQTTNSETNNFTDNNSKTNLVYSTEAYEKALKIYDIDTYPIQYAFTNYHLGDAYRSLGLLYTNTISKEYISKSKDAYNKSLQVINQKNYPNEYLKITQYVPQETVIDYSFVGNKYSLSVSSVPDYASIYMDGEYIGETPRTLIGIEQGSHIITLKLAGYEDWSQALRVEVNKTFSIAPTLTPIPTSTSASTPTSNYGSISVTSSPVGASIYLEDGTYEGETPKILSNIMKGSHIITLKLAGYEDWSQGIDVDPDNTFSIAPTLTPTPASTPT